MEFEAKGIIYLGERKNEIDLNQAALHLKKTLHINEDGRYEISIPLVEIKSTYQVRGEMHIDDYDLPLPS